MTLTKDFWMLKTEVTQEMYSLFDKSRPWAGRAFAREGADYPAVYVSAKDADAWCRKATAAARKRRLIWDNETIRLPTEAEWEYAARAGTTTKYFFGDNASSLGEYAWYCDNAWDIGEKYAHQVGRKKPNPWGLLDVCGNVWEWCADGYQSDLPGGTDPRVLAGSSRVCRGGSFGYFASGCRVGSRNRDATYSDVFIGFRVVLSGE